MRLLVVGTGRRKANGGSTCEMEEEGEGGKGGRGSKVCVMSWTYSDRYP